LGEPLLPDIKCLTTYPLLLKRIIKVYRIGPAYAIYLFKKIAIFKHIKNVFKQLINLFYFLFLNIA